jgi:hypothetical protein
MGTPTLIFCSKSTRVFSQIASKHGWKLGSRSSTTVYYPIYFADQNWKKPNKDKYIEFVKKHKPYIATVLDWEEKDKLDTTLEWAEEISTIVDKIIIIPKIVNGINLIPTHINNKEVVLGYSVPTRYGGTITPLWEFGNRKVHLLGGSPQRQYALSKYLNVVSLDCNMMMKMANWKCAFWDNGRWVQLKEIGMGNCIDAPYKAFEMSCISIKKFWING